MLKTFSIGIAEPKIHESNGSIIIDQQILRLEISMHDVEFMYVLYSSDDLLEDSAGFVFRNPRSQKEYFLLLTM